VTHIIIEIGSYLVIAILLGAFFGWLITKLLLKKRYEEDIDEISKELVAYKKDYKLLKAHCKELSLKEDSVANVDEITASNGTMDEFQKRLDAKDELIATLTSKLTLVEEKQEKIEKQYEEEIDAFMFERIDTTQKYKALLEKFNALQEGGALLREKSSWFSRLFSSSSVS